MEKPNIVHVNGAQIGEVSDLRFSAKPTELTPPTSNDIKFECELEMTEEGRKYFEAISNAYERARKEIKEEMSKPPYCN